MKSGWIIFTLVVISITLTSIVTMTLAFEFGVEGEKNIFARFFLEKFGVLGLPILSTSGVFFIYFSLTVLRKLDVRVASSFLLTILLISASDLTSDIRVLVAGNSLLSLPTFFLLIPAFAIFSLYLFITNRISPLEF